MKNRRQTITALVLSALMLLGSIAPPGYQHAHAKGDAPHQHHDRNHHQTFHDGHHHEHGGHGYKEEQQHVLKKWSVPHIHFAIWVFDATVPVRDDSDADQQASGRVAIYRVRAVNECLPTDTESDVGWIETASALSMTDTPATAVGISATHDTRTFLCDSARHERSGVQLF